jgi:hypothetical protein
MTQGKSADAQWRCSSRVIFDKETRRKPLGGAADAAMEKERRRHARKLVGFCLEARTQL